MITYQIERAYDVIEEIQPLIAAHYEEICAHPEVLTLDPDYDKYVELCDKGFLRIMTVRDEGSLIGYLVCMITPHLHYIDTVFALVDLVYIDPAYRGGTVGYRLFKRAAEDLKTNCGVKIISVHMKIKHQFRRLLQKLGYVQTEENWEVIL